MSQFTLAEPTFECPLLEIDESQVVADCCLINE